MIWLVVGKLKFLCKQKGFTLIEILVALAIMSAIGVGLFNAVNTNARATRQLDETVVATNLATAYIEAIKARPYAETYPAAETIITVPSQYNVTIDISFSNDGASEDGITWVGTYTDETIQKLTVIVSRETGPAILTLCAFKTKRVVE